MKDVPCFEASVGMKHSAGPVDNQGQYHKNSKEKIEYVSLKLLTITTSKSGISESTLSLFSLPLNSTSFSKANETTKF